MRTPGLVSERAPVLVLALGNRLLGDDGVGAEILARVEGARALWGPRVEFVDGGTRGLALIGELQDRAAVVVFDAVRMGSDPGSTHVLGKAELLAMNGRNSSTAHEGGVKELLSAMELLGETPERITVVGVEPAVIETKVGLSKQVEARLGETVIRARQVIEENLGGEDVSCNPWQSPRGADCQ